MMISFKHILLFCSILLFSATSCKQYSIISSENMVESYKEDFNSLYNSIYAININDSISNVQIEIVNSSFLYKLNKETQKLTANTKIKIAKINALNVSNILDSISVLASFEKDSSIKRNTEFSIPINVHLGENAFIYVSISDINRDYKQNFLLEIDKSNKYTYQWFEPQKNIKLINKSFICEPNTSIEFSYLASTDSKVKCYYYSKSFPLPKPPFVFENSIEQNIDYDSILQVSQINDTKTYSLNIKNKGIYFVSADEDIKSGFSIICTDSFYPEISTHESMSGPIRYISSQKEFNNVLDSKNIAKSVEDFWLKIGNGQERTRNLIRKYYYRVKKANSLFTSYTQGWQTDRGMIYIVLGPPNIVYNGDDNELWIYGEENNLYSATLTFQKISNKFSNNDYILERSPLLKEVWFRAVDIWRQ